MLVNMVFSSKLDVYKAEISFCNFLTTFLLYIAAVSLSICSILLFDLVRDFNELWSVTFHAPIAPIMSGRAFCLLVWIHLELATNTDLKLWFRTNSELFNKHHFFDKRCKNITIFSIFDQCRNLIELAEVTIFYYIPFNFQ